MLRCYDYGMEDDAAVYRAARESGIALLEAVQRASLEDV